MPADRTTAPVRRVVVTYARRPDHLRRLMDLCARVDGHADHAAQVASEEETCPAIANPS